MRQTQSMSHGCWRTDGHAWSLVCGYDGTTGDVQQPLFQVQSRRRIAADLRTAVDN